MSGIDGSGTTGLEQTAGAALAGMWERFKDLFNEQVSVIEDAAQAVLTDGLDPELRDRALREAHKLAGSLGTFGMPRGSEIARELELWFRTVPAGGPAETLRLSDAVLALHQCLDVGPVGAPATPAPSGSGDPSTGPAGRR